MSNASKDPSIAVHRRAEPQDETAPAISLLSSAFVHELNNVLMVVSGNVQLMQMQAQDASRDPMLDRIEKGVVAGNELAAKVGHLASLADRPLEPFTVEQLLQGFPMAASSEQACQPGTVILGSLDQLLAVIAGLISSLSRLKHPMPYVHCCEIEPNAPYRSIGLVFGELGEFTAYHPVATQLPTGTSLSVEMAYAVLAARRHGGYLAASMKGSSLDSLMLVLPVSLAVSESASG